MTFYSASKYKLFLGLANLGFFVLALPVVAIVVAAIWLTLASVLENVKFVHCTEQLLAIISSAQDDAKTDANFGMAENEDIIDDLVRRAQLADRPLNSWKGAIRATAHPAPMLRIEVDVPGRACRRLALFFGKSADDLKLRKMEAHEQDSNGWSPFFDATNPLLFDHPAINKACGESEHATIALIFALR